MPTHQRQLSHIKGTYFEISLLSIISFYGLIQYDYGCLLGAHYLSVKPANMFACRHCFPT